MSESKLYGDYNLISENLPSDSHMRLELQPIDLSTFWKRCGLTANFAASFYSYCSSNSRQAENVISTIVNEMVENAAKFSKARQANITIDMRHFASLIRIEVINYSTSSIRDQFEQYVSKLVSSEPEELYFKHLESKQEGDTHSGLGLLMMMKDYDTRFGFRFTNIEADKHEIAVRAHISLEE